MSKSSQRSSARDAIALMSVLQTMDAASAGRPEMQMDLRSRRLIQALGLGGTETVAMLGQRLGVTPSTMTGIVDRVVRMGYVERRPHPSDRRASLLELTAAGRELFADEVAFYQRLIDRALEPLDDESREHLFGALEHLRSAEPSE